MMKIELDEIKNAMTINWRIITRTRNKKEYKVFVEYGSYVAASPWYESPFSELSETEEENLKAIAKELIEHIYRAQYGIHERLLEEALEIQKWLEASERKRKPFAETLNLERKIKKLEEVREEVITRSLERGKDRISV